jgi:hypothetical protein
MTTTKLSRRLWPIMLVAGIAAAALALWQPASSRGIVVVGGVPAPLGLVGLTEGHTLRISVANVVGFDPQPDPPGCRLQVGFVDTENNTIGNPNILELRPGVAQSFDYVAIGDPGIRQYLRPVVVDLSPKEDCPAVVSGEVLDREGINGIIIVGGVPVNPAAFAKN